MRSLLRKYSVITLLFIAICGGLWTLYKSLVVPSKVPRKPYSHQQEGPVCHNAKLSTKKVAIIGAGSGGSSTAFYLNRFSSPCQPLNITLYERSHYVGGRSTTVDAFDDPNHPVELGASIFVKVNANLVSAANEFGLSTQDPDSGDNIHPPLTLGIWDGTHFVFVQDFRSNSWWNIAKLLWQYGTAPIRTQNLMKKTIGAFLQMYEEPHFPFESLSQVSYDLGLTHITSMKGNAFLQENSISGRFSKEIIQASTRVNYAQNLDQIHALEAMVCMATDGAIAIKGGNWRIFEGMLSSSGANVILNVSASTIDRKNNGKFKIISHRMAVEEVEELSDEYETVVIAAPLQFTDLKISPALEHTPDVIDYVKLYVTLFTSPHQLSSHAFHMPPGSEVPHIVLTTQLPTSIHEPDFYSISTLRTILNPPYPFEHQGPQYLYKIFSAQPVNSSYLSTLLGFRDPKVSTISDISKSDISWSFEKIWHSYPYLPPRVTFEESLLAPNLWYTSGIESFISTMETSSLMGMNVAKLITNGWKDQESSILAGGHERINTEFMYMR
ncbi:hypothetical protein MMC25_005844 [Agyrium rufum]|nr:hypothetical protein [Agyrium rufum]